MVGSDTEATEAMVDTDTHTATHHTVSKRRLDWSFSNFVDLTTRMNGSDQKRRVPGSKSGRSFYLCFFSTWIIIRFHRFPVYRLWYPIVRLWLLQLLVRICFQQWLNTDQLTIAHSVNKNVLNFLLPFYFAAHTHEAMVDYMVVTTRLSTLWLRSFF